ncbi:hypothetical protein AQUCO_09600026v1 [Aquilegia coerulea]|uniref:Fibronectin type-III domain-containing protein n=2 Tax=Aquilegia coerulea TaxID=218851 RepID=A0A2G5C4I8_AQUCA|nr:hypothetical protein AQUCO_09600026v1 [Aquilegia coerulea]PIA26180.1 hypothetical protein AQUCO_09600026v1 [Aquilegia coerulea]
MDPLLKRFMLDPSQCNNLSMEEKRELVHNICKWSDGAPELLQSWSRRELLQILCAETGKERKYTGLTKSRIIDHLLTSVCETKSIKRKDEADVDSKPLSTNNNQSTKRQRKTDNPSRLPVAVPSNSNGDIVNSKCCPNLACRATLHQDDSFCKRCSCCICFQYDDNKDPSLWLFCSSEAPHEGNACGMSCHLECAIKHERSGILKDEHQKGLDGSFECIYCGKVNDLLSCWRKQLMTAKDTRRVDVLCYRVFLSQKLLFGTNKYQKLNEIVETAAKKLEAEVGPIAGSPVKMARGIVNRLSSGPDIQKLCASAVEALDLMISANTQRHLSNTKTRDSSLVSSALVRFENVNSTSLTVVLSSNNISAEGITGYTLWHRKADAMIYSPDPTCKLVVPNTKFLLSDLSPATEYRVKVVPFNNVRQVSEKETWEVTFTTSGDVDDGTNNLVSERDQSPTTNSSSLSNPSSEGDESNNITAYRERVDLSGKGLQETPADSISVLEDERTWEDVSVHNSAIQSESLRNSTSPISGGQINDIPQPKSLLPEGQFINGLSTFNGSNCSGKKDMEIVPHEQGSNVNPFLTPTKIAISKDRPSSLRPEPSDEELDNGRPETGDEELYNACDKTEKVTEVGSSTKKKSKARVDEEHCRDGSFEKEYAYCVKMIRSLECEGYIEKNFRLKFLTWYSLRATPEEKRVVKVFVDTFVDDPVCLAGQLVDTFSEDINKKRPPGVLGSGFCTRLFH